VKTILALLLSCLPLCAATTYTVLTDSANRTFPGGVTNVFFLNSNVVTTGTMRATGVLTLTNSSNVFAGDGSGLTGISAGINTSGGSATNLTIRQNAGNALTVNTNALVVSTNDTSVGGTLSLGSHLITTTGAGQVVLLPNSGYASITYDRGSVGNTYAILDLWSGPGMSLHQNLGFSWGTSSPDSGFRRPAAGLVTVTDGVVNSTNLRDIAARSFFATNLYATNLVLNGGAPVTGILSATASLNFDLTAVTVEDKTMTVTGASVGDVVTLGVPNGSVTTSVQYTAWVSAADTVTVRARTSATGEDPASGTFRATVIKH
jgi:hypothetical protein